MTPGQKAKEERNDLIVKMYVEDKLSMPKIGEILGMQYKTVHYVLERRTPKELRQSRMNMPKLTENEARNAEIIRLFNEGKSLSDIALALKLASKGVAAGVTRVARKKGLVTRPPETQNAKNCKKPKKLVPPITARQAKSASFADALPDKAIVKAEQLRKTPIKHITQIKSNITNLPLRAKPIKPTVQSVPQPAVKTKTKLADGIRAALPPKCKYELHNPSQSLKLPRKNPEYIWCPHDIVRGNYCEEHYNLCHAKYHKGTWSPLDESRKVS